jgi:hypothetical protein
MIAFDASGAFRPVAEGSELRRLAVQGTAAMVSAAALSHALRVVGTVVLPGPAADTCEGADRYSSPALGLAPGPKARPSRQKTCTHKIVSPLLGMRKKSFRFEHRHNGMRACSKNAWAELLSDVFGLFENVRAVWKQRCQNNRRADLTNGAGFRKQVSCAQT